MSPVFESDRWATINMNQIVDFLELNTNDFFSPDQRNQHKSNAIPSSDIISRWPPVKFLGQLSLEIYLLHDPVAKIAIFTLYMPQVTFLLMFIDYPTWSIKSLLLQEDLSTMLGCGIVTLVLSYILNKGIPYVRHKIGTAAIFRGHATTVVKI